MTAILVFVTSLRGSLCALTVHAVSNNESEASIDCYQSDTSLDLEPVKYKRHGE